MYHYHNCCSHEKILPLPEVVKKIGTPFNINTTSRLLLDVLRNEKETHMSTRTYFSEHDTIISASKWLQGMLSFLNIYFLKARSCHNKKVFTSASQKYCWRCVVYKYCQHHGLKNTYTTKLSVPNSRIRLKMCRLYIYITRRACVQTIHIRHTSRLLLSHLLYIISHCKKLGYFMPF